MQSSSSTIDACCNLKHHSMFRCQNKEERPSTTFSIPKRKRLWWCRMTSRATSPKCPPSKLGDSSTARSASSTTISADGSPSTQLTRPSDPSTCKCCEWRESTSRASLSTNGLKSSSFRYAMATWLEISTFRCTWSCRGTTPAPAWNISGARSTSRSTCRSSSRTATKSRPTCPSR